MKAIYYDGKNAIYRTEMEQPIPKSGESLIRVLMSAVCNTDKEVRKGYRPEFRGVMGHEFVGVVEASEEEALIGKRVVGELNLACRECIYCKTGRPSHCSNRRVLGMHGMDGCFAEYMTLHNRLIHVLPDGLTTDLAIYTEPLAAAFEITMQLGLKTDGSSVPQEERNVAVIGDGKLSLCVAQVMALTGLPVTVIGRHPDKLEAFRGFAEIALLGEPEGYEIVVEATGSPSGIETALRLVRKRGVIVQKSTYAQKVLLDLSQIAVNEITLIGSRCGPFVPAIHALADGLVSFPLMEQYDLSEFEQAFASGAKAGFVMSNQ